MDSGIERRGEPAKQGDGRLGAALFDALDVVLGHRGAHGNLRDGQVEFGANVAQSLAEGEGLADRDVGWRGRPIFLPDRSVCAARRSVPRSPAGSGSYTPSGLTLAWRKATMTSTYRVFFSAAGQSCGLTGL